MSEFHINRIDGTGHHIGDGGTISNVLPEKTAVTDMDLSALADELVRQIRASHADLPDAPALAEQAQIIQESAHGSPPDVGRIRRILPGIIQASAAVGAVTTAAEQVIHAVNSL